MERRGGGMQNGLEFGEKRQSREHDMHPDKKNRRNGREMGEDNDRKKMEEGGYVQSTI
jgi:hypothetical protein